MLYLKLFEDFIKESYSLVDILHELGYTKVKKIANGGSSVIYTCSLPNTILKVTNNKISANTMQYIQNNLNDNPNFIHVKKVRKITGNLTINDIFYNHNEYYLNSYPLYVMEFEDLEQLSKSEIKNLNYDELYDICDSVGITHQDLHKDNVMKRKSDNKIVMVDVLDDSLPQQNIETVNL